MLFLIPLTIKVKKLGRPGEKRNYKKEYKSYHSKPAQKKKRAERNKDHAALEKKTGKKLPPKVRGKSTAADKEAGHTKDFRKGGTKKTPVKRQTVKSNRGWRKGKSGYK